MEGGLREKANLLRRSLEKSQATTEKMIEVLTTFDRRLSTIDAALRPFQVKGIQNVKIYSSFLFISN
jgi:hypothetical protein